MYSTILNLMQVVGGLLISVGYIPQIIKTNRIKKVDEFSPTYYMMVWLGVGMCFLYGVDVAVRTQSYGLVIGQGISFTVVNIMLFSYLAYRSGKHSNKPSAIKWQKYYDRK